MRTKKQFFFVLVLTLVLAWVLGVLRFNSELATVLFKVLLFPFGFFYSLYEKYSITHYASSHFMNDEFFQVLVFGFSILFQAVLFYSILIKVEMRKRHSIIE